MVTARFRSCYRGVATFDVFTPGAEPRRAEWYWWTAEQYRGDYAGGSWNYTPEAYERERVSRAGSICDYLTGAIVSDEVRRAIEQARAA